MDIDLKHKHFIVTGASGGIGSQLVKDLLSEGACVTAHFNNNPVESGERLFGVRADVTDEREVKEAVRKAVDRFGPAEGIVINHGIWIEKEAPVMDMSLEQWERTLAVDLTGAFLFAREFLKVVQERSDVLESPSIVFIGSTAGVFGETNHADYASAKAALRGLMLTLKNEIVRIHHFGRANTIAPGWVHTPMAEQALEDEELVDRIFKTMPLRKVASPKDISRMALFLLSKGAGHISGQEITVAGGMEGRALW